jgi:hypothetical protein
MHRRWSMFAAAAATLLCSAHASAQARASGGLGNQGQLVLSAERVYGIQFYKSTHDHDNRTDEVSGTAVSFLWAGTSSGAATNPAAVPRIALDYLVTDVLTLGGSFGLWSFSGTSKSNGPNNSTSDDLPSEFGYALAPRIGGAFKINEIFTIWPRGGLTIYSDKSTRNVANRDLSTTYSGVLLDLECQFAILPAQNFGFGFAPTVDVGVAGTRKGEQVNGATVNSTEDPYKVTSFGLVGSVLGFF